MSWYVACVLTQLKPSWSFTRFLFFPNLPLFWFNLFLPRCFPMQHCAFHWCFISSTIHRLYRIHLVFLRSDWALDCFSLARLLHWTGIAIIATFSQRCDPQYPSHHAWRYLITLIFLFTFQPLIFHIDRVYCRRITALFHALQPILPLPAPLPCYLCVCVTSVKMWKEIFQHLS